MTTKEKIVVAILLLIPIFKGLYFYHEAYFYGAIMSCMLFYMVIESKKIYLDVSIKGLCLFFITGLNFVSISYGIDYGMAFLESLKWLIILITYLVFLQLNVRNIKRLVLKTIFYSGIIVSLIGIVGVFVPALKQVLYFNNRLGSTIQYPNAVGVFFIVSLILGIGSQKLRKIDSIGAAIIISSVILTFSRSIYVLLVAVLILLVIYDYDREKVKTILVISFFGILIGVIIGYMGQVISTINRVGEMTPNVSEFQSRLAYYEDGIKLMIHRPMGIGGLGYKYIQKSIQTAVYNVKYIHNGFLQIAINNGIAACVLTVVMFCDFFINGKNSFYEKLALFIMLFHSLIDFDFEFPLFFIIIVLIFSVGKTKIKECKVKYSPIGLLLVSLLYLYMFTVTYFNYSGDYIKAMRLYPYYTEARVKTLTTEEEALKVLEQNKYVVEAHSFLVRHYDEHNDKAKKIDYMRQLMAIEHLEIKHVENYSHELLIEAKRWSKKGELEKTQSYLKQILDLELYVEERRKEISERAYKLKHLPVMVMTPNLIKDNKEAKNMLKTSKIEE